MAEEEEQGETDEKPKKKGGLVIGLVLAVVAGGGAFAFTSGMIGGGAEKPMEKNMVMLSDGLSFIPVEPMTVAIGNPSERRFLRFRAELEVAEEAEQDITKMLPRVVDVLNTYLQSLEMEDIEDPSALLKLRSQMRRRVDLVVGGDRVHDLLVLEFVVN